MASKNKKELKLAIKQAMEEGKEHSEDISKYLVENGHRVKSLHWLRMFMYYQMGGEIEIIRRGGHRNKYQLLI